MIQRRSSPDDWFHKNATPKQRTNLDIYGRTLYITRARSQVALAGGVRGLWVNRPGIGSGAGIQTPMHVTTDKSQSIPSTYSFFLFPKHKTHTHTHTHTHNKTTKQQHYHSLCIILWCVFHPNSDQRFDIENCLREMESCFDILVPRFLPEEEDTVQPSVGEGSKVNRGAEFRGRTLSSSGSFVSLVSSAESEGVTGGRVDCEVGDGEKVGGGGDGIGDDCEGGDVCEGGDDVSSEDSDVEWEEVEPLVITPSLGENGLVDRSTSFSIQLPTKVDIDDIIFNDITDVMQIVLEETEDNVSVLAALSETHHLLQDTYLPRVNKWLEVI